jgi:SAM-dependent methyltransferase
MTKRKKKCVYLTHYGKCGLKFNRGKTCIRCDEFEVADLFEPVFDSNVGRLEKINSTLTDAFNNLARGEERKFHGNEKACRHSKSRYVEGHYHFIPRPSHIIMDLLTHSMQYISARSNMTAPKFLDCGCGVGNVVILAHFAGFEAYGIEYDKITLARGRRLLKQFGIPTNRLMQGDILDYPKYHEYDLLYGYCPMCNGKLERKFEEKLRLDMKIGALVAGLGGTLNFEKIGKERIYFKLLRLDARGKDYGIGCPAVKVGHETI